ncbi:MAG: sensor histidine kinase [Bacteroidetes bacterium]|nr:MAG: sensor histidine kinase [Bacteroidota bacterium]
MRAYRVSVNLKLGLVIAAVAIAVASLAYTNRLVRQLREREQAFIELWARALEQVPRMQAQSINPYQQELAELEAFLQDLARGDASRPSPERLAAFREAVAWAQGMPPAGELNFITNEILVGRTFSIPAIVTDSSESPRFVNWRNVPVDTTLAALPPSERERALRRLERLQAEMDRVYDPIPIVLSFPAGPDRPPVQLRQYVHYGESRLIRELRWFPYVQLLFIGLFILVGYLGFSYVRRSEQRSLWVGMAKEAAHQLGTPISSLMGWLELLRLPDLPPEQRREALDEVEKDIERLKRVTSRFSDIGSLPKLEVQPLGPVIESTADYIRRRVPQQGKQVALEVRMEPGLQAPLNAELFEWVIENLLKNALDAIETESGRIDVEARRVGDRIVIDVRDTGRGIDRRQWKNVFRPGYSTKKRGWGLGLSLAKRIVEDYHGGELTLTQSRPGQGTTFRIELPAA